jgi:hypothetical protein
MNGWLAANKKGHPKRAAFFAEHVERARCQAASMGNDWLRGSPRARIPIVVVTRRMSRMACSFSLPALRAGWSVAFYHILETNDDSARSLAAYFVAWCGAARGGRHPTAATAPCAISVGRAAARIRSLWMC